MVKFICPELGITIVLTDEAIEKIQLYMQTPGESKSEAGGLLFCRDIASNTIVISEITPPSDKDIRKLFFFKHAPNYPNKIIKKKRAEGHHYIGDWHSHPEKSPRPSQQDRRSILKLFNESTHDLNYMCHLILSDREISESYVCLTDGHTLLPCMLSD
jgi:integrative and conjugative element protein (TIGR02256 family)